MPRPFFRRRVFAVSVVAGALIRGAVIVARRGCGTARIDQLEGRDRSRIAPGIAAMRLGGNGAEAMLEFNFNFQHAAEIVDQNLAACHDIVQISSRQIECDFRADGILVFLSATGYVAAASASAPSSPSVSAVDATRSAIVDIRSVVAVRAGAAVVVIVIAV